MSIHIRTGLLIVAFAAVPFLLAGPLAAEESKAAKESGAAPTVYVLQMPDDGARFHVTRQLDRGSMLLTLRSNAVVDTPPTIVLRPSPEAPPVTVVAVSEGRGTWRVTHDLLKAKDLNGTIALQVGTKMQSGPLMLQPVVTPRYGGHLIAVCGRDLEVLHNPTQGSFTVYAGETKLGGAPLIVLSEPRAAEVRLVAVEGQNGVWRVQDEQLRNTKARGVLRLNVDGKDCETELVLVGAHGGRIVSWAQGPRYEVVPDTGTIYFIDETWEGRPYTIESPTVVYGTGETARVMRLEPVPNEPRAYRVVGANARFTDPGDARLRLTLFGKSLETSLGLSGLHVGVR
jgi:hypothetical protein